MNIRITDSSLAARSADRIALSRASLETVQECIASGKRINRPSDDPFGAEAVLNLRTSQAEIEQFEQNAATVRDALQTADGALESHQQLIDRARALLAQGASDSTSPTQRQAIATEIDSIRQAMLGIANNYSNDRFIFGGSRQSVAPFDSAGVPASAPTQPQLVQVVPNAAPITAGVTADSVFINGANTVFASLSNAANALRGTGNPTSDKTTILSTMDDLTGFNDQANNARTVLGAGMNAIDDADYRMKNQSLAQQTRAEHYEAADLAEAAVQLTQADRAYQATLQMTALVNRRSLLDFIG